MIIPSTWSKTESMQL